VLISEIRKWHWVITWDNPLPADSSAIRAALSKLGRLTQVTTKTTYVLAPKKSVTFQQIRKAISNNLHPKKGNACYVNLRTKNSFQYSSQSRKWSRVN